MGIVLSRSLVAAALAALVYWLLLMMFPALAMPWVIFLTLLTLLVVYGAPLSVSVSG